MKITILLLTCSALLAWGRLGAQEDDNPKKNYQTRSYDVSAIVGVPSDSPFSIRPQGNLVFQPWTFDASADMPPFGDDRLKPKPPDPSLEVDQPTVVHPVELRVTAFMDLLGRHLTARGLASVGPYEELEGLAYRAGRLFLHGPPEFHEEVPRFLKPFKERARRLVHVDCLLVPREVLDALQPGWRTQAPYLADEVFDKALVDKRTQLISAVAQNGQKVAAGSKEIHALLTDHEINQTGVIPVSNPVVETPLAGELLHVRPLIIPGEDAVLLDLGIGRFRVTSTTAELGAQWSNLDLPVTGETLLSATTVLRPGKTYVAGSLGGKEGTVALVRAQLRNVSGEAALAREEGVRLQRTYDVSLLLRGNKHRRWWEPISPIEPRAPSDPEALLELIRAATGGDDVWGEEQVMESFAGQVYLAVSKETHETVDRLLQAEIRRHTQVAVVDLELLEVPREVFGRIRAQTEQGFLLAKGWRKVLEESEDVKRWPNTLTGLAGESHALRLARLHSLVTDVVNVSGGTGFAIIERSDPIVNTCAEGREFRVQVDFLSDSTQARLHLQGAQAEILEVRKVPARFPSLSVTEGPGERSKAGSPNVRDVVKEIQFSLPRQKVRYWDVERDLPLDREVVLDSGAGEGEKARLLVARVRKLR